MHLFIRIFFHFKGLFQSLSGPTLLYLADNVGATVGEVSAVFTGRSAGFFVGSFAYAMIVMRYRTFKPLLTVGESILRKPYL